MKIHLCRAGLIFAMMIVSSLSIASAQAQTSRRFIHFKDRLPTMAELSKVGSCSTPQATSTEPPL